MPLDQKRIIELLEIIGCAAAAGENVPPSEIAEIAPYDSINRQWPGFWEDVVPRLSDRQLARVIQGLTYVESHLRWSGGSASAVISLFRELINRKASPALLDQVSAWVLSNTSNDYSPFGTTTNLGARNYSEYLALSAKRAGRIKACLEKDVLIAKRAVDERANRRTMAARSARIRGTPERAQLIEELNDLPIEEKLRRIASHESFPPQFFPTIIADSASQQVISTLPRDVRLELARRLKGKRRGPWGSFKKRLLRSLGNVWDRAPWDL